MENPAILLRRLNPYCARAMEGAASLCQTRAQAEILPEHWLLKLLELGEGDLTVLARRYEWDMDSIWQDLLAWLDKQPRSVRHRPQLSERIQTLMQEAWMIASLSGEAHIRSVHLLMALVGKPALTPPLRPDYICRRQPLRHADRSLPVARHWRTQYRQPPQPANSAGTESAIVKPYGSETKATGPDP